MSWTDHHRRTEIVHEVLDRAAVDPADPVLFQDLPDSERLFGGPAGLLAALRYRWDNHLHAKLDMALLQGQTAVEAFCELAAEQPALRALLDANDVRRPNAPMALAS